MFANKTTEENMSELDFHQALPNLDKTTEWYLLETVYCLEHYVGMTTKAAYETILSSSNLMNLLRDDPRMMHTEPAFYWAMCIVHGFGSLWWHDKHLWALHNEYVKERHHPPVSE